MLGAQHGSAVSLHRPRHVLMTVDAVGGVWRYALDLAATLKSAGFSFTFAGFGPPPSEGQRAEADAHGDLVWLDAPLDWMATDEHGLRDVPALIAQLVEDREIDLVHLNLPSQAAGPTSRCRYWQFPTPAPSPGLQRCGAPACRRTGCGRSG